MHACARPDPDMTDHAWTIRAPRKDPFHIPTFIQSLRPRRLDKKQTSSPGLFLHQLPPPRATKKPFEHCHALRFCPVLVDYTIHRCHWLGFLIVHTSEARQHSLRYPLRLFCRPSDKSTRYPWRSVTTSSSNRYHVPWAHIFYHLP